MEFGTRNEKNAGVLESRGSPEFLSTGFFSRGERESLRVGQLAKFIPNIIQPVGRIHFVGAYADNLNWGMEAATRSANRVAKAIDQG